MRYFLVAYGYISNNGFGNGLSYVSVNGGYVNNETFMNNSKRDNSEIKTIVISNIIELSESDFNDFKKEDKQ